MKVQEIGGVDKFLEDLFEVNERCESPTLDEFVLAFSPEMTPTKTTKHKLLNKTKKERCKLTVDWVESEYDDKYFKSKKGEGY